MEGIGWYTHELLKRMVAAHPEVEFHFLFDRTAHHAFIYGPNVVPHVIGLPARHPFLWYLWFEFSVPRELRKIRPDVFFSPDNYLSIKAKVPTVLTCHDLIPFHYPEGIPGLVRRYYHRFWPKYLRGAKHVVTVSETTRRDVLQMFALDPDTVTAVLNGSRDGFSPAANVASQITQAFPTLTQGYFLATGSIHPRKNTARLIEAFNLFKTQTGLPHQLALVGRMSWQTTDVQTALEASPYRSDIVLTGYVSEEQLQMLTRHACASVYISLMEGFGLPIVEAMQSGVPVITSDCSSMPEVAGDAAIRVRPKDMKAIAWALKRVIVDQDLRNRLIVNGFERVKMFNWDSAAEHIFDILKANVSQKP